MRRAFRHGLSAVVLFGVCGLFANDALAEPAACTAPKTRCEGHSGYYASSDDVNRLTAVADPILRDVRTCLDGSGAKHGPSALVIRWDSDGKAVDVKIDVPGYESLPCVQKARTKLSALQNPHETTIRCELGCEKPKPATPPAPVVVPLPVEAAPPPATQQAVTTQPVPATPAAPPVAAPRYEKVWYGYQTLIADGISGGLIVAGVATRTSEVTTAGILGFVLATPIIHMIHVNIGPGFGSIGLRIFVPLIGAGVGGIAGLAAGGTDGSGKLSNFGNGANSAINGVVAGGLIGIAGCVLIDAAGFAYTKERVDDRGVASNGQPRAPAFSFSPTFDVRRDQTTVGVAGRF